MRISTSFCRSVVLRLRYPNYPQRFNSTSSSVPTTKKEDQLVVGTRKKKYEPFVKNLFLGKFDKDVLTYPEVLEQQQYETTEQMHETINKFFTEHVDSKKIDEDKSIPPEVFQGLRDLGLFGLQIPEDYGGLQLNASQFTRVLEAVGDASVFVTLAAHQSIGLKGIILFGTEEQKQKYLPSLASGEKIAAFCLTEATSGSDAASIQTQAVLSEDGKTYRLSGTKIFISNGGIADVMTVFARTKVGKEDKITAFIVERDFGKITSGKPEGKMGIQGSNTTTITFEETPVPISNVIGEVGEGFKIAVTILNSGRFSMGASTGLLRKMLADCIEQTSSRIQFKLPLIEFESIQLRLANVAVRTYVIESMAYLTAGLIDSQDKPDCSIEAAIVKVFSSEAVWQSVYECQQIFGGMGYMKDLPYERYVRDVRILPIFEGTNEVLRLFISLSGCQHAGIQLAELVRKMRNPFSNPSFAFKEGISRALRNAEKPKLDLGLYGHLHPNLHVLADMLEGNVKKFSFIVERKLSEYGKNILTAQGDLFRLADVVIDLYAMTAVLGRASRSYCIGLRNADMEMSLARIFCDEANIRIKQNIDGLSDGMYGNGDALKKKLVDCMIHSKEYCFEHPLARNWS